VSIPSIFGMKLYTCKNLPKMDENRSTISFHFWKRNIPLVLIKKLWAFEEINLIVLISLVGGLWDKVSGRLRWVASPLRK